MCVCVFVCACVYVEIPAFPPNISSSFPTVIRDGNPCGFMIKSGHSPSVDIMCVCVYTCMCVCAFLCVCVRTDSWSSPGIAPRIVFVMFKWLIDCDATPTLLHHLLSSWPREFVRLIGFWQVDDCNRWLQHYHYTPALRIEQTTRWVRETHWVRDCEMTADCNATIALLHHDWVDGCLSSWDIDTCICMHAQKKRRKITSRPSMFR